MLKYLAVLAVFLGFAFVIARHDEYTALKGAQEAACKNNSAAAGKPDECHPQEHSKNTAWDSPSGHIFHNAFRWPEGTTVWAIILTLLAIAEQTGQTRKATEATQASAEATRQQAEIASNSQRSWIIPKSVSKPDLSGTWIMKVSCEFEVYGSSPVRVYESQIIFDFFPAIPVGNTGEVIPDLPENPDYGEESTTLTDSPEMGQVWAPGSQITVGPMLKGAIAKPEQLQALKEGKNVLCLYGFINYRDAFDKSKMRTTRFCYICGKKGVLETKYEEYFVLGGPPEYNEAD
jgi:hypothetical protein